MTNQFIGSGIIFPIEINSTGSVDVQEGNILIQSSIKTILYWPKHQRFFNKTFGCRIFEMIEEPNDNISKALIRNFIFDALDKWEKRIIITDTNIINYNYDSVSIEIKYIIRSTRAEETMVFPFYKNITF